ncbi:unnamed protein product, partial [marine sediment metagenome]
RFFQTLKRLAIRADIDPLVSVEFLGNVIDDSLV